MTPEEAIETGRANLLVENNLSSVKIAHNSKGTTWEIKVKHDDPIKALETAEFIDARLRIKYGTM